MKNSTLFMILVLGGLVFLAKTASAVSPRPPRPIIVVPPAPTDDPVVSAS